MSTITGTVTNGVTLGQAGYTSPLTITAGGLVTDAAGHAVFAPNSYPSSTIVNSGTISADDNFNGVQLLNGGNVHNAGGHHR